MTDTITDTRVTDIIEAHTLALRWHAAHNWHLTFEHTGIFDLNWRNFCKLNPGNDILLRDWQNATFDDVATSWDAAHAENAPLAGATAPVESDGDALIREAVQAGANDSKVAKLRAIIEERNSLRAAAERTTALYQEQLTRANRLSEPITDPNDDRVMQLWANAAQEADTQGYCSVYDQISSAVGIPTRDELRDGGYLTQQYEVDVEVTFTVTVTVNASSEDDATEQVDYWDNETLADNVDSGNTAGVIRYETIERNTRGAELA